MYVYNLIFTSTRIKEIKSNGKEVVSDLGAVGFGLQYFCSNSVLTSLDSDKVNEDEKLKVLGYVYKPKKRCIVFRK